MSASIAPRQFPPRLAVPTALLLFALLAGPARAGSPEPKESVALARSWEAAVEEARLLNVPIVVHSHGFFCGPCWGMHSAVMLNKKYIEFSDRNTVEVISLQRLQEGIDKGDKRAEVYEEKVGEETVKYMVEFPGLTIEDMLTLERSKANTYNKTGGIPYTCLVDPWTEEEITHFSGSTPAGDIMDAVTAARAKLEEEHGRGVARKEVRLLAEAESEAAQKVGKGDFAAALNSLRKAEGKSRNWPEAMTTRLAAARERVLTAATALVEGLEAKAGEDAAKAKAEASRALARLKGTGLEERARRLLAAP